MKKTRQAYFHQNLKEEYQKTLPECSATKNIANLLRRVAREVEEPRGKDVFLLTEEELKEALSQMGYASIRTLRTELSIINGYLAWARSSGLVPKGKALKLHPYDVDIDANVAQSLVKDPTDLLRRFDGIYQTTEGYSVLPVLCLFWLGFERMEDILSLRSSQVDVRRGNIYRPDGGVWIYHMPEPIRACLQDYAATEKGVRVKGRQQCPMPVSADRMGYFIYRMLPQDSPWRGTRPAPPQIHNQISHFVRKYQQVHGEPCRLTPKSIVQSGRCFRLHEQELAGQAVTGELLRERFHLEGYSQTYVEDARRLYEIYKRVFWPGEELKPQTQQDSLPAWLL